MSDFPDHSDIAGRQTLDAGLTTLTQLPSWKCPPSSSFSLPQRFFIDLTLVLMKAEGKRMAVARRRFMKAARDSRKDGAKRFLAAHSLLDLHPQGIVAHVEIRRPLRNFEYLYVALGLGSKPSLTFET